MLLPEKYESIFDVSSKGPSLGSLVNKDLRRTSSGSLLNKDFVGKFTKQGPTKGLCSKRRRYFHIFQVEAYLTYCQDMLDDQHFFIDRL